MNEPFTIRRRIALYAVLSALSLAVAGVFVWLAIDRSEPVYWAPAVVLAAVGLIHARGLRDARTPLFVADDHGIRLLVDEGWVGLLWSEMSEIVVERRKGMFQDPRVKVVSGDGDRVYAAPVGLSTDVSPGEAEIQLARRRPAAAY